jgi:hypothetical protein
MILLSLKPSSSILKHSTKNFHYTSKKFDNLNAPAPLLLRFGNLVTLTTIQVPVAIEAQDPNTYNKSILKSVTAE